MRQRTPVLLLIASLVLGLAVVGMAGQAKAKRRAGASTRPAGYRRDIVTAVKAAAQKDCGCQHCAAKGCEPCHGKNCYFCAAKALVAMDCGCKECGAKGCSSCGPGCDVCKFHLAPVAEAKTRAQKPKTQPHAGP